MLLDILLDFVLIPVVLFIAVLFVCDMNDWERSKKEVESTFVEAFYVTTFLLAFLNVLLLMSSCIFASTGDYALSLTFDLFILVFTCLNISGLFVSEYWKRKLRG